MFFRKKKQKEEYSEEDKKAFERADKIHGWIKGVTSRYSENEK